MVLEALIQKGKLGNELIYGYLSKQRRLKES